MQSYLLFFSAKLLIEYSPLHPIPVAIAQTPKPSCATFVQSQSVQQNYKRDSPLEGLLALTLFGLIALGLIGYKKYYIFRSILLNRQRSQLEKSWKINT
jgi:hypothetical protein